MDERVICRYGERRWIENGQEIGTRVCEPDPEAPSVREVVEAMREVRHPLLEGTPDCPELVERLDALIARLEGE